MNAPGPLVHLLRRFFGSLRSRRPTPADQVMIGTALTPAEAPLFWSQPVMDQRHATQVARRVASAGGSAVVIRAALLHDVGKRHSHTGVIGRSIASGLALLHLPTRGSLRAYLDHGNRGADDLMGAGSDPLVVAFAAHHHHQRPEGFPLEAWAVLSTADDG